MSSFPLSAPVCVKIVLEAILDLPTFTIAIGIFLILDLLKTFINFSPLVKLSAYIPIAVTLVSSKT